MQARILAASALALGVLCLPQPSQGQIASHMDERGKLVYTNAEQPQPAAPWLAHAHLRTSSAGSMQPVPLRPGLEQMIRTAAQQNRVDDGLLRAVVRNESAGNVTAVSNKGAMGLMQLMPFTAERFGVANVFDPASNLDGGARYLRFLLDRYAGDLSLSLAAYNAGEKAVDEVGGIPPYEETRNYVRRVMSSYRQSGGLGMSNSTGTAHWPIRREADASGRIIFTNE
jgi:Transglycosylase SLT domain